MEAASSPVEGRLSPGTGSSTSCILLETAGPVDPVEEALFGSTVDLEELFSATEPACLTHPTSESSSPDPHQEAVRKNVSENDGHDPSTSPLQPVQVQSDSQENRTDEEAVLEAEHVRRVLANRQSARESRARKLQKMRHLDHLIGRMEQSIRELLPHVGSLQSRHARLRDANAAMQRQYAAMLSESNCKQTLNRALRDEVFCLRQKTMAVALASHDMQRLCDCNMKDSGLEACLSSDSFMSHQVRLDEIVPDMALLQGQHVQQQRLLVPASPFQCHMATCQHAQESAPGAFYLKAVRAEGQPVKWSGETFSQPAHLQTRDSSLSSLMLQHCSPQLSVPPDLLA